MNPKVDKYLIEGCGRCSNYRTPQCKVHTFVEPMQFLRDILLHSKLIEEYKWSQPCYSLNGKNVIILTAFKDYCCLSFFKGSLMKNEHGVLVKPGKNSQAARQLRYTRTMEIIDQKDIVTQYINEAINIEKSGAKVDFKEKNELKLADELVKEMSDDPSFMKAFERLTPGRQRGYNLYFSSAKQATTRKARIIKYKSKIMEGKGFHDR